MKKIVLILTILAVLTTTFAGCAIKKDVQNAELKSNTAVSKDTSWEDIKAKGKIVIGLDDAFPPMGFRDKNNQIVGFDIDLAKATAEKMGLKVEFKPVVWDSIILELNNKNIDLIWNGLTVTPEREKQILFTKPYLENRQVIVTLKDSNIKTKADLKGVKVGLQSGSSAEKAVKSDAKTYAEIGANNIMKYKDNNSAMMDLEIGRVKAVVLDEIVCRYYISKKADKFKILDENFGNEVYAVGARLHDKAFVSELQKAFDAIKANGKAAEISKKWFGEDIVK